MSLLCRGIPRCRHVSSTSRSSTPTTTCTRPRTRSPSSSRRSTTGSIEYVEVNGPHQDRRPRPRSASTSPTPPSSVVAAPGAQEEYFKVGNPEGKTRREIMGKPIRRAPRLPRARAPARADGRARHRPGPDVADPGQPARGAPARRPDGHPRVDPRPQPVDARALDVQLRGPDLPDAGDHPADRGRRPSRSSSGCSSGAPRSS